MISVTGRNNHHNHDSNASPGFTLIEVMVAATIVAVCVVSILQAFISCLEGRIASESYNRATSLALEQVASRLWQEETPTSSTDQLAENNRVFEWSFETTDPTAGQLSEIAASLTELTFTIKWQGPGEQRQGQILWKVYKSKQE